MELIDSLKVLAEVRNNEVVVTSMGSGREWVTLSDHPLDFVHVPSSMGQTSSLGLGLALARPDLKVVACAGDGSTLMNLGSLVTISAAAPENLVLLICDNGIYEVTGGQKTPAQTRAGRHGPGVELTVVARACGISSVFSFDNVDQWRNQARTILDQPGPTVVVLKVAPVPGAAGPRSPGPGKDRALVFADELKKHRAS